MVFKMRSRKEPDLIFATKAIVKESITKDKQIDHIKNEKKMLGLFDEKRLKVPLFPIFY